MQEILVAVAMYVLSLFELIAATTRNGSWIIVAAAAAVICGENEIGTAET